MKEGTIKNILDAVRDWVNNKEQAYKPGEIYECVPNEIIKMLWEGDVKFDELVPVTGAEGLNPVSKLENYLHFINIFYDIEEIKQNALTFTNIGDEDESFRFYLEVFPGFSPTLFLIEDDDLVPFELDKFYTIPAHSEIKIVGYNPTGKVGFHNMWYFDGWSNNSNINISGKLTSLIDIVGQLDILPDTADFSSLFKYSPVVDASGLILPNNVTSACYYDMFRNCTSLIKAPELPATVLASSCYGGMFQNCRSLIQSPELPATTLAEGCYSGMFSGCTSLTEAPELPATTLVEGCYSGMFASCRSLNYIKCLATNISAGRCTPNWVRGVANNGTFVKNPNATDWQFGNNGIPTNWEVEDDVINYFGFRIIGDDRENIHLHMGVSCVNYFEDTHYNIEYSYDTINWHTLIDKVCDNATYMIPNPRKGEYHKTVYFRGNNKEQFYKDLDGDRTCIWFVTNDLYELEVFGDITTLLRPEGKVRDLSNWFNKPSYEPESEIYSEPIYRSAFSNIFSGDSNLRENLSSANKLILYPKVLTEYCYGLSGDESLFFGCTSLITVPKLPATILAKGCYSYMFSYCTNLIAAPVLPATTLANNCYSCMFTGCSSLISAPELPATTLADWCYSGMFSYCGSLTYIKCLAVNGINQNYSTLNWLYSVANSGTFVKHPDATDWPTGNDGIPTNWTVEDDGGFGDIFD